MTPVKARGRQTSQLLIALGWILVGVWYAANVDPTFGVLGVAFGLVVLGVAVRSRSVTR